MSSIDENIRRLRKHAGMSQAQLAGKIGRTRSAISQYESGMIIPRMGVIEDLATALRVAKSDIIGETQPYSYNSLSTNETELIGLYRRMEPEQQAVIISTARTFALSGRAVCAGCGRNMQGMSGRGRKNVKYEYYTCVRKCVPNVRRDALEGAIAAALRAMLADRERTMEIARLVVEHADTEELEARRRAARKSRDDARRGIANLVKAMEMGAMDESVVKRLEELRAQESRAAVDLMAFDDEEVSAEDLADFLQCGRSLDDAALLDAFVWQAVVDGESAVVVLNYDAENSKPATLDVPLVRENCKWLPLRDSARISVCAVGRLILVRVNLRKCA